MNGAPEEEEKPKFNVIDFGLNLQHKPVVLVVDDEPSIQSLVFDSLSDDFSVMTAPNGREGVAKARHCGPDLVLMDVLLPDISGREAVRLLREDPSTKEIPVVMVTAHDFDKSAVQAIQGEPNVAGFLTKPFKPKVLREMVKAALERRRHV
ncbi:MAG: response regulator [Elusimicrobia bacterium]|nr:response regulator [Candidatus Obscuribacterium magneticum]